MAEASGQWVEWVVVCSRDLHAGCVDFGSMASFFALETQGPPFARGMIKCFRESGLDRDLAMMAMTRNIPTWKRQEGMIGCQWLAGGFRGQRQLKRPVAHCRSGRA